MTDTPAQVIPADDLAPPRPLWVRAASFGIGILLLLLAAWVVWRHGDDLQRAWASIQRANAKTVAILLLLPLANWALTSAALLVLTRKYGRVGAGEMHALVGSAWLLNYLPLKPGLFGRVAYHKLYHNIAVKDSIKVLMTSLACGGVAVLVFLAFVGCAGFGIKELGPKEQWGLWITAAMLLVPAFIAYLQALPYVTYDPRTPVVPLLIVIMLRLGDIAIWSLRFGVAFTVLGEPQAPTYLLVIAAATQAASLLPIQFGLSEWAAGLALGGVAWLAQGHSREVEASDVLALGLAAGLLNRAAELPSALLVGLISMETLRRRRSRPAPRPTPAPEQPPNQSASPAVEKNTKGV